LVKANWERAMGKDGFSADVKKLSSLDERGNQATRIQNTDV